jgi:two-component system OmpR family response regulator
MTVASWVSPSRIIINMKILVIEDDQHTAFEILNRLALADMQADHAADGDAGLEAAMSGGYDAITLDRLLPSLDGLEIVSRLRDAGLETPVLMISALTDVDDRITGLRAGGDDYMVKPFNPDEMVARLEVLMRRARRSGALAQPTLRFGELELDMIRHEARRNGRTIELLPMEFKLLEFMIRNAGQVLTRRMIFEQVWDYYFDPGTNLIDVHVGRLRRKIDGPSDQPLIRTIRRQGYSLGAVA